MPLPDSFRKAGFIKPVTPKYRRLMVTLEGPTNSGKSEFAHSAPGPGIFIAQDRGLEAMLDNPNPPTTRQPNFFYDTVPAPLAEGSTHDQYKAAWKDYRDNHVYKAIAISDCRTIVIDGDSDSWETQRLAAFGKLTQIPSIMYTGVNAARRLFVSRLYDSGKIIISTNKVKKLYKAVYNTDGTPKMGDNGRPVREWDGFTYEPQGFEDHDYLWQVRIAMVYDETRSEAQGKWGARLIKAKANPSMQGYTLWGEDCCMQAMVQTVYPNYPLSDWGY
jgi:hypothetical protein